MLSRLAKRNNPSGSGLVSAMALTSARHSSHLTGEYLCLPAFVRMPILMFGMCPQAPLHYMTRSD